MLNIFFPLFRRVNFIPVKYLYTPQHFYGRGFLKHLQDCVKKKNTEYLPLLDLSDSAISIPTFKNIWSLNVEDFLGVSRISSVSEIQCNTVLLSIICLLFIYACMHNCTLHTQCRIIYGIGQLFLYSIR